MGLLSRLKTALGLGSGRSDGPAADDRGDEGGVRVEHEPDASTEAAVKGTDDEAGGEPAAAGTDAAASTGSMVETPPEAPGSDDVAEAAEPAEAAGPASQGGGADDGEGAVEAGGDEPETEPADDRPVREISGIGPAYERRLEEAGVGTVGELAAADAAALAEAADIAQGRVENWIERARESAAAE